MRENKGHAFTQSSLYGLKSTHKLAGLLKLSPAALERLTSNADQQYREFDIKQGAKTRRVEAPSDELKGVQGRLASLLSRITPEDYLYCPAKRRCYVRNAAKHRQNRVVACLDISMFFPSTLQRRVFTFFQKEMRCARDVAGILAQLACYKGHLPTGSPLSPIMAHYAFVDVWRSISTLCSLNALQLTVYVDDVTISGDSVPERLLWEVRKIIHGAGLAYHKEKRFVDCCAEVTGVIIRDGKLGVPNRKHLKMHVTRKSATRTRNEIDRQKALASVRGMRAQWRQVERL